MSGRGYEVVGFFFNPNIHPWQEYSRRLETLRDYATRIGLPLVVSPGYEMEQFLRQVVYREQERCRFCYTLRLTRAAQMAKEVGATAFTTTLLYSRYQKHDLIREIGFQIGLEEGVAFYYEDFRRGWREGVETSRKPPTVLRLYLQRKKPLLPERADSGKSASFQGELI